MITNFIDTQYLEDWIGRTSNPSGVIEIDHLHSCYRVFEKDNAGNRRHWSHERIDAAIDALLTDGVIIHHTECPRRVRLANRVIS